MTDRTVLVVDDEIAIRDMLRMALDIAEDFKPLDSEEMEKVKEMAGEVTPLFQPTA